MTVSDSSSSLFVWLVGCKSGKARWKVFCRWFGSRTMTPFKKPMKATAIEQLRMLLVRNAFRAVGTESFPGLLYGSDRTIE